MLEDAKQKSLKSGLSLSTKFKMYVFEKNTEIKVRNVLHDFHFFTQEML